MIIAGIALIIFAYLIGSFPYMLILSRAKGITIKRNEDFHITTWRRVGPLEGMSGIIIDILKGVIPVVIGFVCNFQLAIIAAAGVAAVIGQMWPVFQRFNGEKGNTTGIGMSFALCIGIFFTPGIGTGSGALWVMYSAIICFLAGILTRNIPRFMAKGESVKQKLKLGGPVSNSMPLGMLAGFLVMPIVSWILQQPIEMTLALALTFILIVVRRLTANLSDDLKTARTSTGKILLSRFLLDRSYF